jgi:predicted secreted protein
MAEKIIGTKLKKTSGTPFEVGYITNLGEAGVEADDIEITNFDSANGFKEYISGLKDGGEISLEGIINDEAKFEAMMTLAKNGTTESWEIESALGRSFFFTAYVKMWKIAAQETGEVRRFTGSLKLTGPVSYDDNGVSA